MGQIIFEVWESLSEHGAEPNKRLLNTDLETTICFSNLIGMFCMVSLRSFRCLLTLAKAKDVWNNITSASSSSFRLHAKSNLNMWLAFDVRVVLRILAQSLPRVVGIETR